MALNPQTHLEEDAEKEQDYITDFLKAYNKGEIKPITAGRSKMTGKAIPGFSLQETYGTEMQANTTLGQLPNNISFDELTDDLGSFTFDPKMDYEAAMANNQNFMVQVGASLAAGVIKGGLTALEDVGYMMDLTNWTIPFMDDVDTWEGNMLSDLAVGLKEDIDEGFGEIYRKNRAENPVFDPLDFGSYAEALKGVVDSGVGFLLPGLGIAKGLSMASKAMRLQKYVSLMGQNPKLVEAMNAGLAATATNYAEGKIMGMELHDSVLKGALEAGHSREVSEEMANDAASSFLLKNRVFILTNYIQLHGVIKGIGSTRGGKLAESALKDNAYKKLINPDAFKVSKLTDSFIFQGAKEYGEEVGQFGLQAAEEKRALEGELGFGNYLDNFIEAIGTSQAQLEGSMGIFGAGGQKMATNLITGNYGKDNETARQAALRHNTKAVEETLDYINSTIKQRNTESAIGKAAAENEDESTLGTLGKMQFYATVARNLATGTTDHIDSYLKSIEDGSIGEERLNELGEGAQERASELREELISLEKQWIKDSSFNNPEGIFRSRLFKTIYQDTLDSYQEKADGYRDGTGTDTEDGAQKALEDIAKTHTYKNEAGETESITFDIDELEDAKGQPPAVYEAFLKDAKQNENLNKYLATKEIIKDVEQKIGELQKEIDFSRTPKGEAAWKKEQEKKLRREIEQNKLKNTTEDSEEEYKIDDTVSVVDEDGKETIGIFQGTVTNKQGEVFNQIQTSEDEIRQYPVSMPITKKVATENKEDKKQDSRNKRAADQEDDAESLLDTVAKKVAAKEKLTTIEKEVYKNNKAKINIKAAEIRATPAINAKKQAVAAELGDQTIRVAEDGIAQLEERIKETKKKYKELKKKPKNSIYRSNKGIEKLEEKYPEGIPVGHPKAKDLNGFKANIKRQKEILKPIVAEEKKELAKHQEGIIKLQNALSVYSNEVTKTGDEATGRGQSIIDLAADVAKKTTSKKSNTSIKKAISKGDPSVDNDDIPEETTAIYHLENIGPISLQVAWKSLNASDPEHAALIENARALTELIENPNNELVGTTIQYEIDEFFLSKEQKKRLKSKKPLSEDEILDLPIAAWLLGDDGKKTGLRFWLHNGDFDFKNRGELDALLYTKKIILENINKGIPVASSISEEGYGVLNTVEESTALIDIFGEEFKLVYRADKGTFIESYTYVQGGENIEKEATELDHSINIEKQQGGVFISGIKAANGVMVPIKVAHQKLDDQAATLVYMLYKDLISLGDKVVKGKKQYQYSLESKISQEVKDFITNSASTQVNGLLFHDWTYSNLLSFLVHNGENTINNKNSSSILYMQGGRVYFGHNNNKYAQNENENFFMNNYEVLEKERLSTNANWKYNINNPNMKAKFIKNLMQNNYFNVSKLFIDNKKAIKFWANSGVLQTHVRPTPEGNFFVNPILNFSPTLLVGNQEVIREVKKNATKDTKREESPIPVGSFEKEKRAQKWLEEQTSEVEVKKAEIERRREELENSREIETLYDLTKPIPEDSKENISKINEANKLKELGNKKIEDAKKETNEDKKIELNTEGDRLLGKAQNIDKKVKASRESIVENTPIKKAIKSAQSLGQRLLNKLRLNAKSNEWNSSMPISKQEFDKLNDATKRLSVKNMGEVTSNSEVIPDILLIEKINARYNALLAVSEGQIEKDIKKAEDKKPVKRRRTGKGKKGKDRLKEADTPTRISNKPTRKEVAQFLPLGTKKSLTAETVLAGIERQTNDPVAQAVVSLLQSANFNSYFTEEVVVFSRPLKGFMELTGYTREKANTTPAVYDPDLNRIYVNEEWATIMPLSDVHTLLLHELMHAATEMPFQKHGENKILNAAEKEFVDTITALYSLTKSKIKKEIYGLKSNSEFVSEVMTNPSFRSEINKADKSIWRRIMNAIRKFFGLTPKNSKIITRAETAVKNFIDKSKEFTPSEKLEIYNKRGYIHAAPINTEDNNVLNRFNEEEIEEITDAMIYIIMDSAGIENIRDFKSLSSEHKDRVDISSGSPYFFGPVNDWLLDHVEDLEEQGFEEEANKINYAMEPLIFDALYKEAQLKLKQYYGVILNEEDELETRDSGNITKDAVEINWKDNASTNTKLLIAFNPKVDINDNQIYSKHFKLPAFNNFTGTWNLLQSQLADIVSEEAEEDVVKAMAKKIEQIVPIAPSLRRIQYFLEDPNTPEQKKTQFASAFALSKINYTTTLHSITDSGIKIYKIGNSENMGKVSNEQILLNSWEQNLVTKIVDSDINNYNKASVNAEKALDLVAQYRALESAFRKVIRKHKALDDTITDTFIESINTLLQNTGITIDPRALYLLKDEYIDEKRSIEEDNYFFIKDVIQNILGRVYVQTKLGYSINNLILKGEEGLEKNYGIVKTAITNDKELLKLAKYGIMFTDLYSENMVQGAKGNKYWAYSKYHYISKFLAEAKQDPNMLKELAEMPFYQHSELLQYLLAGEETTLLHWNQFKEEFSDHLGDSFSDIKKVDDMADRMNRILKGFYPYINAADKSRHYNIKGPKVLSSGVTYNEEVGYNIENSEGIRRITGHVIDEIANSYVAYEQIKGELTLGAKNTIPRREHVLHFHYKLAKDGITKVYSNKIQANGELFDKDLPEGFPVGNWTKLSTLPSLSYGTPLARRLGLYKSTGQPFSPSPDMYERIDEYVGEALLENINEQVETAKGMGVFRQISTSTMTQDYGYVENIIKTNEEGEAVGDITQEDISSHESHNNAAFHNAHADIVFNSIYMNLEMTKLFIGDTRFYKNPGDLKKRTPGGIGTGTDMRIYKDSKGEYVVKPTYTQATGRDVIKGSDFFTKENIPLIANALAIGDKTIEEATKEAKKLVEGYSEGIDIADAQAWITMDRAIEIFRGTGTFTKEHEANLDKIKKGTANYKLLEIFFQPIKGMHYELRRANGMAVPTYLKYSQSILHPALTAGNDLDNLRTAMEDQGVDEFTVVQGIKVGATDIADWYSKSSTITQNDYSYYRGQYDEPNYDLEGNLVLYGIKDDLYKRAGYSKSKGVSMTDNLETAVGYGKGQFEGAKARFDDVWGYDINTWEAEEAYDKLEDNGYWLIQIPKNISNEIIKEEGEVKVIGDKIVIPKGQYKVDQVDPHVDFPQEEFTILPPQDIILNPVTLQNKYWKLQQELTPHGLTQSLVGSQVKKNIIANIDLDTIYEIEGRTISGRDLVQELHDIDIQLSDEGAIFISDKLGYDMGTDTYYDQSLLREYLLKNMEDMPRAMRDAVATGLPFDAFPQFVESISSKLTNAVTKKTVKLKQLGGSYIQQSPVGFFGNNKVPDFIKDNLVMIDKKSKKIKGPRVVGETIAAGQVLLPHQVLDELKEKFPELTTDELLLKIDKKMLEGIGYRIPNQANSSNEAINIAGFLPSFMGDTVVVYEEITTKTGSDFDIDKMFILLPNYRVSKKKGATKIPFLEKDTVVEKDKQGNDIPPLVSRYLLKWGDYKRRNRIKTLFSEFEAEHADELTTLKEALIEIKGDEWYAKELAALRQISLEELQETEEEATMLELAELLNDGKDIPHKFLNKSKASIEEQKKNITSIFNVLIKGYYKAKRFAEEDLQKLRIAIEEMAMNKAVEEGYIPSMETFESLPINKQNTIKALQNKRIELYRSILLHPSKFNEVMTPLDADDIADNIKSLIPSEGKKPDLYYYTMLSQLDDKHNFNGGKFGVGLTANQLVDAALSQAADIYMNISGLEDIANYNDDGTLSLAGQRDTKGRLISHIISGYLNAYVDIAKDEYIIKGNHNILTANTVFMLLRAGVPFEWVNAFINQPILRDYVKLSQKSEGRTTDFLHVKNTLTSMYTEEGSEKETDWTSILEESPSKLLENLSEEDLSHTSNPEEYKGNKVDQLQVLNAFLYLRDKSKALSDSILTSKQDTIGAGRSLWDAYTMINRIEDVLETNEVGNFSNKFIRTALGQFTENSVGLANRMFKNLFVNSSVSFRDTVDSVSKLTTGKKVTKVEFAELVSRELYAGVMSDPYHLDKEEYNDLWFGKNHIAKQLMVMQKDPEFEENSLIKILKPRIRYKGNPSTIKFHNSKGTNPITDNMLIADWERLYFGSSELGKKFATNLMYVAYFQSGFKTRAGSFDHLIPPSIQVAEGIADSTMGVISDVKNNVNKLDTVVEQIFRHNSKNSELVPVLRNGFRKPPQMHKINAQVPIRYAFSVPIGSNPDLIIGADANNNFVHKPFVLRKVWDNAKEEMVEQFFEYYGNHSLQRYDKETGKEFNQNNAIYVRTHTLGVSNKGDIITEYDINSDKTSSNFPKNSITFGLNTKTSNPLLDQFKAAQNYVNNGIAKNGYIKAPGPVVSNNISITMDKPKIYTPSEQAVLDLIKKCK